MKFTKDEARKELMGKIPEKGQTLNLSERSINEQLDTLMPLIANDEAELNDFISKVLPIFKTADGNVKNDVSVGINKYKTENPIQQTKKQEPQKQEPTNKADDANAELIKRLTELENKLAQQEKEKRTSDIRAEIISKLKEKGVEDTEWSNSLVSEIHIAENFNVDEKVESYLKLYNKSKSAVNANASPEGASAGGKQSDKLTEAIAEAAKFAKSQRLVD